MTSGYHLLGATASGPSNEGGASVAPSNISSYEAARRAAVMYLDSIRGTPYIWASKDPSEGLDCSGAYTVALEHAGLAKPGARYKYGSADLQKVLARTSTPRAGDAVFYGSGGNVSHVMMATGDGRVIGATGGGRNTKTESEARAAHAEVKYAPIDYRKDIISYGLAPTPETPLAGSSSTRLTTSDVKMELGTKIGYGLAAVALATFGTWATWWLRTRSSQ